MAVVDIAVAAAIYDAAQEACAGVVLDAKSPTRSLCSRPPWKRARRSMAKPEDPKSADDLLRDSETFHHVVETVLGLPQQPVLPGSLPTCI